MATFAARLNFALEYRNIKPSELARTANINEGAISQYRKGIYKAKQPTLDKMAKTLNVSTTWLMGVEEKPFDTIRPYGYKPYDAPAPQPHIKGVKIPVLRRVVAGVPIEAIEEIIDYEEIKPDMATTGEFFALKAKGSSMEPYIIEDDIVIVRKTSCVEDGALAIVLVNGYEATCKKIKIQNTGITLIGLNVSVYEPHFYCYEEVENLPVQIIGKVVEIRRSLKNV